jgi:2-methylfumaryl-CoA isomerase
MPATPLDFGRVPRLPAMPAPALGEHTDQILLDILGLSEAEVGRLHDAASSPGRPEIKAAAESKHSAVYPPAF